MMPTVARFLLLVEFAGFDAAATAAAVSQRVPELPVVVAVLVNEAHLGLAQDAEELSVLADAGRPRARLGLRAALQEHAVHRLARQHHQLQLHQRVLEVLLRGRADIHTRVGGLERSQQQALICLQHTPV